MSQNYMHQQCSSQEWNEGGNSLVAQWLALGAFTAVAWIQSLVRELRSCKPPRGGKPKEGEKK